MARLTVSLDERTAGELEALPGRLERLRASLASSLDSLPAQERSRLDDSLVRSLDELGDEPSSSAILREALRHFLAVLSDLERASRLEAGYAALAAGDRKG